MYANDALLRLWDITWEARQRITRERVARKTKGKYLLIIEDDGIGFDPEAVKTPHKSGKGLGLIGMNERAGIINGSIELEAAPCKGTTIFIKVPFAS